MIIVYRPELENPPMDKECSLGFTFVGEKGGNNYVQVKAGVTRDFPETTWEKIKDYAVVKNLMSLGALRIEADTEVVKEAPTPSDTEPAGDRPLSNLAVGTALGLIESSFDLEQLKKWDAKELRIRVKNAIQKRIQAITEGKG